MKHTGSVRFVSEGLTFSGQVVNISRSGMQIMVNLPDSYRSVRCITFTLPNSGQTVELPCRLVRAASSTLQRGKKTLGLEFSYQAEAQLLLIENFIRELKQGELSGLTDTTEMRQVHRASCSIRDIQTDSSGIQIVSIDNISHEGILISYTGTLRPGECISFAFCLPGDERKLDLTGCVMYVIQNSFRSTVNAGIRLNRLKKTDSARITNFVLEATSSSAVRKVYERIATKIWDPRYQINDKGKIADIFHALRRHGFLINILFEGTFEIFSLPVKGILENSRIFTTARPDSLHIEESSSAIPVYLSFYLKDGSYYFKTELIERDEDSLRFRIPRIVYQSEKRSYQRKLLRLQTEVQLLIEKKGEHPSSYTGKLIDISWRGFLCELPLNDHTKSVFVQGQDVQYLINERFGLENRGVVRHLKIRLSEYGQPVLRVGIEAGIQQAGFRFRRITSGQWQLSPAFIEGRLTSGQQRIDTIPVFYRNEQGQEIAALLNSTRLPASAPVVVVPPAFGKKKEALSPLVCTLLSNFRPRGKDLVVLRYDGINRPGESYNKNKNPRRGSEMLHCQLSQGLRDLRTTLTFIHDNPYFSPQEVILITFSMSSIDARKVLMDGQGHLVDIWVSCMGIPSAKSTIGNILGGIDIIGNHKMGIPNGTGSMLGYLVNFDTLAHDLIKNKYAYITDARSDMSKIRHPVLWIYGSYDKWAESEEVKDIMAVKAAGQREVIEIPAGHNLRSSSDAIKTFKIITSYVYERLYGEPLAPSDPDKEEMVRMITYERERLVDGQALVPGQYWKSYLMGTSQNSSGYDFYRNIRHFRDFLILEAELIDPAGGERIADMGCGTGLLTEVMLKRIADAKATEQPIEIAAVDLIREALTKTREKWDAVVDRHPHVDRHSLYLHQVNLEPNRMLPVKLFIDSPELGCDFLRNRIQGLRNVTLDLLDQKMSPELMEILRGSHMTEKRKRFLTQILKNRHQIEVLDLNRAARFVKRRLRSGDLKRNEDALDHPLELDCYRCLSTKDIRFESLDFGDNGLDFKDCFDESSFDKIAASLFISYILNPDLILNDFYRMLKPGGLLLVSSMKPDSDISTLFTDYIDKIKNLELKDTDIKNRDLNLAAARAMLNEAAALFTLEEDGYFRFYSEEELIDMLKASGFTDIESYLSLGTPAQAVVVTGKKL